MKEHHHARRDQAAAPALAAAALAEADAEAIVAWLRDKWAQRLKPKTGGLGPRDIEANDMVVAKDADGEWVYLVRKEKLADVVPNPKRLDEALGVIAKRGGLRPSMEEGKLTRQKRLSDGTKKRFLFFVPDFVRPKKAGPADQQR